MLNVLLLLKFFSNYNDSFPTNSKTTLLQLEKLTSQSVDWKLRELEWILYIWLDLMKCKEQAITIENCGREGNKERS